jgi:hypothetical protein
MIYPVIKVISSNDFDELTSIKLFRQGYFRNNR